MKKESLEEVRIRLIDVISKSTINPIDKAELMINLYHLLDIRNYDEAIKTLAKKEKRWINYKD